MSLQIVPLREEHLNEVAKLQRKPDAEIIHPLVDFATWEHERLLDRGLIAPEPML